MEHLTIPKSLATTNVIPFNPTYDSSKSWSRSPERTSTSSIRMASYILSTLFAFYSLFFAKFAQTSSLSFRAKTCL